MSSYIRNASIGLKVALAPAFAIVCLVVVALMGGLSNHLLSEDLQAVGGEGMHRIDHAQRFARDLTELHQMVYQSLTWESVGKRPDQIQQLDESLLNRLSAFDERVQEAAAQEGQTAEQQATFTTFANAWISYSMVARDTLDMKAGGAAAAATFVVSLDGDFEQSLSALDAFVKAELAAVGGRLEDAEAKAMQINLMMLGVSVFAAVLAAILSWIFMRSITRPLQRAAYMAGQLAQGNLTEQTRDDEASADATGHVLAAMDEVSRNLSGVVDGIRRTAEQISSASNEIATGNADLSVRTEGAASALQQAAASIEELSDTLRINADRAQSANALAGEASRVAREGGEVVSDVVNTMDAINAQAKRIAEIIGTIDGIAFQTNILALNAAVEAARAGEQGRGFAVVAGEVRSLAQRSAEAAREIRSLIGSSVEQIDTGAVKVRKAGQTMHLIVDAINRVAQTVDEISHATQEQATGISQVNQSVSEMDRSTQQNAAMVEEATAATESLRHQATSLVQMLGSFRTA